MSYDSCSGFNNENGYNNRYKPNQNAPPYHPQNNNYDISWLKGTSAEKIIYDNKNVNSNSSKENDYSHPVYKKLSKINGRINSMSVTELMKSLAELNLDTGGRKEVLVKRLKFHHRQTNLMNANIYDASKCCYFDYVGVIDFEATCVERPDYVYPHEIIEFPIVLINMRTLEIEDCFDAYCKPVLNPKLSKYCTDLTGITQEKIDNAPEFPEVLKQVEKWLEDHKLGTQYKFAIATDGPWDMQKFLNLQCSHSDLPYPYWAKKWIDIRKLFSNWFGVRRCGISKMLNYLNLEFEGQQHCGLDDAKNIARVLIKLAQDGASISPNDNIDNPLTRIERKSDSYTSNHSESDSRNINSYNQN